MQAVKFMIAQMLAVLKNKTGMEVVAFIHQGVHRKVVHLIVSSPLYNALLRRLYALIQAAVKIVRQLRSLLCSTRYILQTVPVGVVIRKSQHIIGTVLRCESGEIPFTLFRYR